MIQLATVTTRELERAKCVPCEGGEPPLTPEQVQLLLPSVPGWVSMAVDGHPSLVRVFTFKNFAESVMFVNRVNEVAEAEGHHPDVTIHWGTVRLELWTHATGGLHRNDFILAAKISSLVS